MEETKIAGVSRHSPEIRFCGAGNLNEHSGRMIIPKCFPRESDRGFWLIQIGTFLKKIIVLRYYLAIGGLFCKAWKNKSGQI